MVRTDVSPPAEGSVFQPGSKDAFIYKDASFIAYLSPETALKISVQETISLLSDKFGAANLRQALNPEISFPSPVLDKKDPAWFRKSKITGINARVTGNFFNIIKYLLTVPKTWDTVHLLPFLKPGLDAGIYGITGWTINPEFFSTELMTAFPHLDTVEKQLKVTINILHLMGKTSGMDVMLHTDRFSETVLMFPRLFEWVKRIGGRISAINDHLHKEVEEIIWLFLHRQGAANHLPVFFSKNAFFDPSSAVLNDTQREEFLFGKSSDSAGRLQRRNALIAELVSQGYETLPATMGPPYRNLRIEAEKYVCDENGIKWYTYAFDQPGPMSRVFTTLTQYKFYMLKEQSQELDFDRPNIPAWDFFYRQYLNLQQTYQFDFMVGAMAHIQPRKNPGDPLSHPYKAPLGYLKKRIADAGAPYFASLSESFLLPPDTMSFGPEEEHLRNISLDVVLGSLHASEVGSTEYLSRLRKYSRLARKDSFVPSYTLMTADSDRPSFDKYYVQGNHLRFFVGTFLKDLPAYMHAGFECRNKHMTRGQHEEYTFSFNTKPGKESGQPSYKWGQNKALFREITEMKRISDAICDPLFNETAGHFLDLPGRHLLSWQAGDYLFIANHHPVYSIDESLSKELNDQHELIYSSASFSPARECRIYKLRTAQ